MIYVNGDSYSAADSFKVYADYLRDLSGIKVVNLAKNGSCNTRIIRATIRDCLNLKQQGEDITAIIGLSFLNRKEIWVDYNNDVLRNDGNFKSISPGDEEFIQLLPAQNDLADLLELLVDLVMLRSFFIEQNIKYLIFPAPGIIYAKYFNVNENYAKPFWDVIVNDPNIMHLFDFSLVNLMKENGFRPIDYDLYGDKGHASTEGHQFFANWLAKKLFIQAS